MGGCFALAATYLLSAFLPAPKPHCASDPCLGDAGRIEVPLDEIPLNLRNAVIATEDGRFFSHPGIDPLAMGRAVVTSVYYVEPRSGASTITQQVARNTYMADEEGASRSGARKLKEMFLALRIEHAMSKDQILETYLNESYFGYHSYGVDAASWTYFGKSVRDVSLAEAALLAGMLQGPSLYDPFTNMKAAMARQEDVLRLMVRDGYITESQAEAARQSTITLAEPRSFGVETSVSMTGCQDAPAIACLTQS